MAVIFTINAKNDFTVRLILPRDRYEPHIHKFRFTLRNRAMSDGGAYMTPYIRFNGYNARGETSNLEVFSELATYIMRSRNDQPTFTVHTVHFDPYGCSIRILTTNNGPFRMFNYKDSLIESLQELSDAIQLTAAKIFPGYTPTKLHNLVTV